MWVPTWFGRSPHANSSDREQSRWPQQQPTNLLPRLLPLLPEAIATWPQRNAAQFTVAASEFARYVCRL